jgi:leucyl aminopeptidase
MKITVTDTHVINNKVDGFLFFMEEDFSFGKDLISLSDDYFPHLKSFMKDKKFIGKTGQTLSVYGSSDKDVKSLMFVGVGKKGKVSLETYRRALAQGLRSAEGQKLSSVSFHIPTPSHIKSSVQEVGRATGTISLMTDYMFDEFLTGKDAKKEHIKELIIVAKKNDHTAFKAGIKEGLIIGESVNRTRHWVDLPANILTPDDLAKKARALSKKYELGIKVFDEKKIESMGMGGLKAVGMGSANDSKLIILEYTCKNKNAPTLALVGKGITFDTGGVNLKPTGYLDTMKEDMAGAAAVINSIAAIAQLKPNVNVVAIAAAAENMLSGSANRPGDIITFYNGKTAVVGNTDAEGRLVLADALAYASKHFKPAAMIDVATLTGAVAHAVGPFFNGMLTEDDNLAKKVEHAADTSGDPVWRLPLIEDYKVMVKSHLADICNDGKTKYYAGPTNGACFLSNFVGDTPWVHIDMGASAFNVPDLPYFVPGATGAGVRLMVDFVMQWK